MRERRADPEVWWGRVFAHGTGGGNHTAVVSSDKLQSDPATVARRLAVPDTAFVSSAGSDTIRLRTFSPHEELSQCLQTSLAVVVALEIPEGQTRRVCHEHGEPLLVRREGRMCWAHTEEPGGITWAPYGVPLWLSSQIHQPTFDRVAQTRSRLLVDCRRPETVAEVLAEPTAVLSLCAEAKVNGLVLYACDERRLLVRVFTTSLGGREDTATGGAVLNIGSRLLHDGAEGAFTVTQGPLDPDRRGYLHLRLEGTVSLGGEVLTLARGALADS